MQVSAAARLPPNVGVVRFVVLGYSSRGEKSQQPKDIEPFSSVLSGV